MSDDLEICQNNYQKEPLKNLLKNPIKYLQLLTIPDPASQLKNFFGEKPDNTKVPDN